jgi:hypothetical protein
VLEEKEKEDKKRVLEEKQARAKVEEEKEARELPKPSAQTVNCPNCGQSYPKEKKYAFCTRCSTELPIQ